MANGIDWFRWHHGSVTDPKFQLIAKKAGASLPDVLAVWAYLLESASASDVRGHFSDIDAEALDCLFSFPDGRTASILSTLGARGLICENNITSWDKRQPKREREDTTAAERKRAQRERDKAIDGDANAVTPSHDTSRQVTPREEESREEKKEAKSKAEAASSDVEPTSAKKSDAIATRLPADWMPSYEDARFCEAQRPDLSIDTTAARFRDYWIAQPGAKGRKTDWPATWRNWVRNEKAQARASPQPYQTSNDKAKAWADRLTGRNRNDQHADPDIIDINPAPRKLG